MDGPIFNNRMNDPAIIPQDDTVAPQTRGAFPSGIRFGLNGSLDADDLMRRALGYSEQLPAQQEGPDEAVPSAVSKPAYFDIKSISVDAITIRGGVVRQSGRGLVVVPDTDIIPAGTELAPNYAVIKISAYGPLIVEVICLATYPEDDGTWLYRALYEVYAVEAVATVGLKCDEVAIRNPIGP